MQSLGILFNPGTGQSCFPVIAVIQRDWISCHQSAVTSWYLSERVPGIEATDWIVDHETAKMQLYRYYIDDYEFQKKVLFFGFPDDGEIPKSRGKFAGYFFL